MDVRYPGPHLVRQDAPLVEDNDNDNMNGNEKENVAAKTRQRRRVRRHTLNHALMTDGRK